MISECELMSAKKIYLTTQIPTWVQAKLTAHLSDFEILRLSTDNLMEHKAENVLGLMVRSQTQINTKLISHFKDLKIVGTATSGFDHLDLKVLKEKNIIGFYTPDANVISTADLTMLHILMALRNNFSASMADKNFVWKNQLSLGQESQGRSLGILGLGRIGKEVAKRALSFGFKVFYHDPYLENLNDIDPRLEPLSRLELFTHCDLITLHVPLTQETKHIINWHTLDHFGEDKILINCARGELVNTQDMLKAIDKGILKYVCLDTFETEPLSVNSLLRHHPRIFWTPHIGAHTQQAYEKACFEASNIFVKYFQEQTLPLSVLPPKVAWAKNL